MLLILFVQYVDVGKTYRSTFLLGHTKQFGLQCNTVVRRRQDMDPVPLVYRHSQAAAGPDCGLGLRLGMSG